DGPHPLPAATHHEASEDSGWGLMELPPIKRTAPPDYPARVSLRRGDTDEIQIIDLKHEAKARALRRPKEIAGALVLVISALGSASVGIIKAFSAHDRATVTEYRLDQAEGDVKELKGKVEHDHDKLVRC